MNILQKRDVILAAAILLLAAAAFGISHYIRRTPAAIAQVSVDGAVVETLDLSKDTEITVTSSNGGTNHLIVKDGEIWCSEASCPDKVCVHQGKCVPSQSDDCNHNRRGINPPPVLFISSFYALNYVLKLLSPAHSGQGCPDILKAHSAHGINGGRRGCHH